MSQIQILPEHVANRIAAGEVVVRPSAVVKELIENSLDASATKITVEIQKSGKELIRITDNGCGMDAEDAVLAFKRHATSKIRSDKDLFKLHTYGFRGEAMPSIASVSMMELITAQEGADEGISVLVEGGESLVTKPAPAVKGTQINIRNLFYNTPARRKFLKNDTTEFNHIMEAVIHQALFALSVHFELIHDHKSILSLPATESFEQRLGDIYGQSLQDSMFAISEDTPVLALRGYISRPTFTRSNRTMQKVFVNGRVVKDKNISFAIHSAYTNVLPGGRHCVCFLFLDVPAEAVDVNVHPTKDEVKFRDDASVRSLVQRALKQGIDEMSRNEEVDIAKALPLKKINIEDPLPAATPERTQQTHEAIASFYKHEKKPISFDAMRESRDYSFYESPPKEPVIPVENKVEVLNVDDKEDLLMDTSVLESSIAQPKRFYKVKDLFVVTEEDDGIVIVDQHAAQERVMYERFLNYVQDHKKPVQDLLVPLTLDVAVPDMKLVEALVPAFAALGFGLEAFGEDSYAVRSVPTYVRESEVLSIIANIIDDVRDLGFSEASLMQHFDEVIATMACRASIKAGDKVSDIELSHIFQELQSCDDPHTCPHGRPTMIKLTFDELERKFRRKKA